MTESNTETQPTQSKNKTRHIKLIVGLVISALIFYFIFNRISGHWWEIGQALRTANPTYLILSFVLLLLSFPIPILVWRRIVFDLYDHKIDLKFSYLAITLANISRYIPGKVWFIAIMAWMAKEYGVSKERFVVASILTQFFNLIAASMLGVILVGGGRVDIPIWSLAIILIALIIILQPKFLHRFTVWALRLKHASTEVPTMRFSTVVYALAIQVVALSLTGASMYLMALAFKPDVSLRALPQTIGGFCLSYFLGYISFFTPAGLGVREGSLILLLPVELSETLRATLSIAFRVWATIVEVIHSLIAFILYIRFSKGIK